MIKAYTIEEKFIIPPDIKDFIPAGCPARFLSDVVDKMNLSILVNTWRPSRKGGRYAYNPIMLLKVVLFGYMNNIFSLRGLEQSMKRDIHLLWLSQYQFPDHTTLSRFKTCCGDSIKTIFAELVKQLATSGEIDLKKELYMDGTTIRSKASRSHIQWRSSAERYSKLSDEKIQEGIADLLNLVDEGAKADACEAELQKKLLSWQRTCRLNWMKVTARKVVRQ